MVADCCHSGGLFKRLKIQIKDSEERFSLAHGLKLSSCRSTEKLYSCAKTFAFTYNWTRIVWQAKRNITHRNMILKVNENLAHDFWMDCSVARNMLAFIVITIESKNSFWKEFCKISFEIEFILTIVWTSVSLPKFLIVLLLPTSYPLLTILPLIMDQQYLIVYHSLHAWDQEN